MLSDKPVLNVFLLAFLLLPVLIYSKYLFGFSSSVFILFDFILFVLMTFSFFTFMSSNHRDVTITIGYILVSCGFLLISHPNIPSLTVGLEGFRKSYIFIISVIVGCYFAYDVKRVMKYFYWVVLIFSIYGIKQYYFKTGVDFSILNTQFSDEYTFSIGGVQRISGLFSSPFIFGAMGCFGIVITIFLFKWERFIECLYGICSLILFISVTWLSHTRTNLLILFFLALLILFLKIGNKINIKLVSVFSVFLIGLLSILYASQIWDSMIADDRFYNRFYTWNTVFHDVFMNLKGFVFGYGTGSSGDTLDTKYYYYNFQHISSHNIFLRFFYEGGVLAGILFLSFFSGLVYKSFLVQEKFLYVGSLLIILVGGFSYSSIEIWPINIMIGMTLGGVFSQRNPHESYNFKLFN